MSLETKKKLTMDQLTILNEIAKRLVSTYSPRAVYLFGSRAWGNPSLESDYDLAVVVDNAVSKRNERAYPGYRALSGLGISKDILVYTYNEFSQKAEDITTLAYKIKREGVPIHGEL